MEHITAYFEHLLRKIQQNSWVIHEDLSFRQIDEKDIKGSNFKRNT